MPARTSLLNDLVELQLRIGEKQSSFGDRRLAGKQIRSELRKNLAALRSGRLETLPGKRGIRAAFLLFEAPCFYSRKPLPACRIFLPDGDPAAEKWVRTMVRRHGGKFKTGMTLHLRTGNSSLLPLLARYGLHIDCLILAGDPKTAAAGLAKRYGEIRCPIPDLKVVPLRTNAQVNAVMKIIKSEFTRNPQFGHFVATPGFLLFSRKLLHKARKRNKPTRFLFQRGGRVVGQFGFDVHKNSPYGKVCAGVGIDFDRSIQGQGLGKYAYFILLRRMREQGVEIFIGGTSQKPVMKLGTIMQRPAISYVLRKGKPYFPRAYFRYKYVD